MNVARNLKALMEVAAGGTALAGIAGLVALVVLALVVIPGGLGILTIEFERAKCWLRCGCAFLLEKNSTIRGQTV